MKKRNIVNLVHFVRGVNQNHPETEYMLRPVKEHLRLMKQYDLPCTVLLQYDALIDPDFTDYLKENGDERLEIGLWLEIPGVLAKNSEVKWKGNPEWSWDWHTNAGYLIGYEPKERCAMIDEAMRAYLEIFGEYPSCVGCWMIDAVSMAHLADKYKVKAACICRDQWGTDGMSLWGGYDSIYYPSKNNMFCPASEENQINLPVIRMLVNDPMYNFDMDYTRSRLPELNGAEFFTLEPIYGNSGGSSEWVNWIFAQLGNCDAMPYSYAQIGQENGFGWARMSKGLEYQCEAVQKLVKEGKVIAEKVSDTGSWFADTFKTTPANTVAAMDDWTGMGRASLWYYSGSYRANIFYDNNKAWIRDLRQFRSEIKELYLDEVCTQHGCRYINPPVVDGNLWSDDSVRAGLYPVIKSENGYDDISTEKPQFFCEETDLNVNLSGGYSLKLTGTQLSLKVPADGAWCLKFSENTNTSIKINGDEISVLSDGSTAENGSSRGITWAVSEKREMAACIKLVSGSAVLSKKGNELLLLPQNGEIILMPKP